jgi:ABC-2 type transport system permease protein
MESTQGFHAVMNLVLMPMWMLSGALFPIAGAAGWMGWVMRLNPLTYGVASVRSSLGLPSPGLPAPAVTLAITAAFGLLTFAAATFLAGRRPSAAHP